MKQWLTTLLAKFFPRTAKISSPQDELHELTERVAQLEEILLVILQDVLLSLHRHQDSETLNISRQDDDPHHSATLYKGNKTVH